MERIQMALEKARIERLILKEQNEKKPQRRGLKKTKEVAPIDYVETQKIQVSNEVLNRNRIIAGLEDPRADLFKILRTKVVQRMRINKWNLLAITSPKKGAGKSLTAINLAISIAMDANYSVLLVDMDLRSPSITRYLDLPVELGVSDYFIDDVSIPELLVHPGLENLVILPAGHPIQRSSDLLTSPRMQELAEELKQRYPDRIVVVDLPPLLQTDDALAFMPNTDACLLVVSEGENSAEDVENSISMIDEEKFMGCILNKSTEKNPTNELAYY